MEKKELLELVKETGRVYQAIAAKIEVLIEALNRMEKQKGTAELADKIEQFLAALLQSIKAEKRVAKRLSSSDKKEMALLIRKELGEIKRLKAYVHLASRNPTPPVISAIHQLYKYVSEDIAGEEAVLSG